MRFVLLLVVLLGCRGKAAEPSGAPVIAISVNYPGATAEVMESSVAQPIEQAVATLAKTIDTRCEGDHLRIEIEPLGADLDTAAHELQHALSLIQRNLPTGIDPPIVSKSRKHDQAILWLAVRGTLPITEVSRFAHELGLDLQRTRGIGAIEEHGLAERAIYVRPDLVRLRASSVTMFDMLAALQSIEVGSIATLGDVTLRDSIRLRDVAVIEEGFEREPGAAPPMLAVHAQIGASRTAVLADVREKIKTLDLPPGITVAEATAPKPERPPAPIVATVVGPDLAALRSYADGVTAELARAGITDVVRDPPEGEAVESVQLDRERALALGLQMADVAATLRAISTMQVGRVEGMPIVVKLATQTLPLELLDVRSSAGTMVPLSAVVTTTRQQVHTIVRHNRERAIALAIYGSAAAAREVIKAHALPAGHRLQLRD